jgi:hypothetical protein
VIKANTLLNGAKDNDMKCRYFDDCSAPFCPRDEGIADRTWFSGEDLCRLKDSPEWVKRQRKISRKAAEGGYFSLAMIKQDCRISRRMKGIDPDGTDRERAAGEAEWFNAHPVISAKEREKKRAMGLKNKGFAAGTCGKNTLSQPGQERVSEKKGS